MPPFSEPWLGYRRRAIPGEYHIFENDEGWTAYLVEGFGTIQEVTLHRCDGEAHRSDRDDMPECLPPTWACYPKPVQTTIPLKCTCGKLRGVIKQVSGEFGIRLICMCDDCQAFAHWLERADEILDAHGGTDVLQLTPSQVEFTEGRDQIRCMRMSPKGLMRWYSACCKTPLGNSLHWPKVPFIGLQHLVFDHDSNGRTRDEALGPVRGAINGRFSVGPMPPDAHAKAPLGIAFRAARKIAGGWLRGAAQPSPLFDAQTGAPVCEPTVISREERKRLLDKCGPTINADVTSAP